MLKTILFDNTHNEMMNFEDSEFSEFLNLLHRLGINVKKNENERLKQEMLRKVDLLIIGNPIDDLFSSIEIKIIVDYVRSGGGLLLLSEYGSDYLQKTNINDISGKFGISFEKNIVKEINKTNQNCTSILHIQDFVKHPLTKNVREIKIGGACSLILSKEAKPLLSTKENSWPEIFNNSTEQWVQEEEEQRQIVSAYSEFGRGKIVAFGDIDIFTTVSNIGLNSMDNKKLVQNIIAWLTEPNKEPKVMTFILNQLGDLQYEIRETNKVINNLIETMTILEKRISYIEENTQLFPDSTNLEKSSEEESLQQ